MARLGRSFPVNWRLANRNNLRLNTQAAATLAVGTSVSATGTYSIGGTATLAAGFVMGNFSIPPASASIAAGISLTAGGLVTSNAALPVAAMVAATPNGWQYIGLVPVTYVQYLASSGTLTAAPGQSFVAMKEASGWEYALPVPPGDGNWVTLGGGGQVMSVEYKVAEEADPLGWDPPAHLAHLPVPFEVVARRIEAKRRRSDVTAGAR